MPLSSVFDWLRLYVHACINCSINKNSYYNCKLIGTLTRSSWDFFMYVPPSACIFQKLSTIWGKHLRLIVRFVNVGHNSTCFRDYNIYDLWTHRPDGRRVVCSYLKYDMSYHKGGRHFKSLYDVYLWPPGICFSSSTWERNRANSSQEISTNWQERRHSASRKSKFITRNFEKGVNLERWR